MIQTEHTTIAEHVTNMCRMIQAAGKQEILPRFQKVTPHLKGKQTGFKDIVTAADTGASKFILDQVRLDLPGSYSEEDKFQDRFNHDLVWVIDPVDGTDEFCAGDVSGYCCMAALLQRQSTGKYNSIAGIIYRPGINSLWYYDGQSVHWILEGKEQSIPQPNQRAVVGIIRASDPSDQLERWYYDIGKKLNLPVKIHRGGGAGASCADIFEGTANVYVMNYNYSKDWDIAPAEPIMAALGGFVCDLTGTKMFYNRIDVPGLGEPYNLSGFVLSRAFSKGQLIPQSQKNLLVDRLDIF